MLGKPIPDCGNGGTSVWSSSLGTRLAGGGMPLVHSSSAMNSARCTGAEFNGFWNC